MADILRQPGDTFKDTFAFNEEQAALRESVSGKFIQEMRQASSFNKDTWAKQLSAEVEHQIRRELSRRPLSEIDAEVEYRVKKELDAIKELDDDEARVAAGFNIRPSQYVLYRERDDRLI